MNFDEFSGSVQDNGPSVSKIRRWIEGPYYVARLDVWSENGVLIGQLIVRELKVDKPTPFAGRSYLLSLYEGPVEKGPDEVIKWMTGMNNPPFPDEDGYENI